MTKPDKTLLREFDREMYRSSLVSTFWAVISDRKRTGYKLQRLAEALGIDKSTVSKWFSGLPNWESDTVSDIANALDVEIRITARDRLTGVVYGPSGAIPPVVTATRSLERGQQPTITSTDAQTAGNGTVIVRVKV